jgi:hypothetical protein
MGWNGNGIGMGRMDGLVGLKRVFGLVWFGLLGPQRDNLLARPLYIYAWEVIL